VSYLYVALASAGVVAIIAYLWKRGNKALSDVAQLEEAVHATIDHLAQVKEEQLVRLAEIRRKLEISNIKAKEDKDEARKRLAESLRLLGH
jgi:hypothetical protein